jgi:hypothetical protein
MTFAEGERDVDDVKWEQSRAARDISVDAPCADGECESAIWDADVDTRVGTEETMRIGREVAT